MIVQEPPAGTSMLAKVTVRAPGATSRFLLAPERLLVVGRGNTLHLARRVAQLGARPPHPERVTSVAQRLDADVDDLDDAGGSRR